MSSSALRLSVCLYTCTFSHLSLLNHFQVSLLSICWEEYRVTWTWSLLAAHLRPHTFLAISLDTRIKWVSRRDLSTLWWARWKLAYSSLKAQLFQECYLQSSFRQCMVTNKTLFVCDHIDKEICAYLQIIFPKLLFILYTHLICGHESIIYSLQLVSVKLLANNN